MGYRILDLKIMSKIAKKVGKKSTSITSINVMVSKKASKLGISAEAALVILAKSYGIGTAAYQRRLDVAKQAEIRDLLPTIFVTKKKGGNIKNNSSRNIISKRAAVKLVIEYLIQDQELLSRCGDILMAPSHFDRPINQATLVLEERIRNRAQPTNKVTGENLVNYAFNEDLLKTVLRVASNDAEDQRGFTQILRGVVPAFRNKTHHHVVKSFSREDALRVCGFIDVLLRIVDNSIKVK